MARLSGWKKLWVEAQALMGQAGLLAYDRAKLLCQLFDAADFRADHPGEDDSKLGTHLDRLCGDLMIGFFDLRQLYLHFPQRDSLRKVSLEGREIEVGWSNGNLADMMAVWEVERQPPPKEGPSRKLNRIKQADYLKLVEEKAHAESRLRHEIEMREVSQEQLKQLQLRVETLERENAELRGENRELRRMLDSQLAAA